MEKWCENWEIATQQQSPGETRPTLHSDVTPTQLRLNLNLTRSISVSITIYPRLDLNSPPNPKLTQTLPDSLNHILRIYQGFKLYNFSHWFPDKTVNFWDMRQPNPVMKFYCRGIIWTFFEAWWLNMIQSWSKAACILNVSRTSRMATISITTQTTN